MYHVWLVIVLFGGNFFGPLQTLMNAEMELTNADTIRSARIPEAATTAAVHVATDLKEWDALVSVRLSYPDSIS